MKKLFVMILFLGLAVPTIARQGWTRVSREQIEYNIIQKHIAEINEQFALMGASHSSSHQNVIFLFLKKIGTPVSYKILKELVASGDLDKSYLDAA